MEPCTNHNKLEPTIEQFLKTFTITCVCETCGMIHHQHPSIMKAEPQTTKKCIKCGGNLIYKEA